MSDKLPWFPFYLDKWETDRRVKAMGPVARSHYLILLMLQWREGHIPECRKTLQRLLTLPSDPVKAVSQLSIGSHPNDSQDRLDYDAILEQVLERFVPDGDGGLVNETLKSIREEQLRVMEAKSRGGKHSSKTHKRVPEESPKTAGVEREKEKEINKEQKRGSAPSRKFAQHDFDERDSRKLAEARRIVLGRVDAAVGCDSYTENEFMTAVCEESGLLPDRVRELEQKSKWVGVGA